MSFYFKRTEVCFIYYQIILSHKDSYLRVVVVLLTTVADHFVLELANWSIVRPLVPSFNLVSDIRALIFIEFMNVKIEMNCVGEFKILVVIFFSHLLLTNAV
jgi:hypothetical protein